LSMISINFQTENQRRWTRKSKYSPYVIEVELLLTTTPKCLN